MEKIKLKTLAYNTIKDNIVTCEYAPGTFLSEEQLSAELAISRTPIRDALGRLEQEGLIEIKPKVGITVKTLTIKDLTMCFEIRMLYEPYIIKKYGTSLSDEELARYYQIFSQPELHNTSANNNDEYYQLDSSFHQMIIDICPNHYMKKSYSLIQTQSERFRYMSGNVANNRLEETFREHCEIISACLLKDWDVAAKQLSYHLKESKRATFQLIFNNMVTML